MDIKKLSIQKYSIDNINEFVKIKNKLNKVFVETPSQTIEDSIKVIYVLSEKHTLTTKIIAYCIIYNLLDVNLNLITLYSQILKIPMKVIEHYPFIIADFMVVQSSRRNGYGSFFIKHLINNVYCHKNLSLQAIDDGEKFWPSTFFQKHEDYANIYILKG